MEHIFGIKYEFCSRFHPKYKDLSNPNHALHNNNPLFLSVQAYSDDHTNTQAIEFDHSPEKQFRSSSSANFHKIQYNFAQSPCPIFLNFIQNSLQKFICKSRLQFRNYYIKIIFIKINFVNVKEEIFNA